MEFVYVVPRAKLFTECYPQGFVPFQDAAQRGAFEESVRRNGFFVQRDRAEREPAWKQIIPYTMVVSEGRVLLVRRLRNGGEARLHDKLSIGIGGHVNPEDLPATEGADPIRDGGRREIEEEIEVRGTYDLRSVGLLNDDSNAVGAVHLGVVQIAEVLGSVRIREEDVLEGRLVSREELRALRERGENIETWSSILVDHLDELLPHRETVTS